MSRAWSLRKKFQVKYATRALAIEVEMLGRERSLSCNDQVHVLPSGKVTLTALLALKLLSALSKALVLKGGDERLPANWT